MLSNIILLLHYAFASLLIGAWFMSNANLTELSKVISNFYGSLPHSCINTAHSSSYCSYSVRLQLAEVHVTYYPC